MISLDEAIEHCLEKSTCDTECAKEHAQLAEWLKELKQLRQERSEILRKAKLWIIAQRGFGKKAIESFNKYMNG